MSTTRKALFTLAALGLAAFAAHPAAAQSTLTGTFYHDATQNITSIGAAQTFIANNAPTGIFTSTQSLLQDPGYGSENEFEDQASVTSFLSTDANSYKGTVTNISDGIFDIKGFVNVTTAKTYTFALQSDDGSALFVDGKEVVNDDGIHPAINTSNSDALSAGEHSVEVVYFNHIYNGGQGGASLLAYFGGLSTTPNNPASAAPEPSQFGMLALVAIGLGALAVKARKRTTAAQTA